VAQVKANPCNWQVRTLVPVQREQVAVAVKKYPLIHEAAMVALVQARAPVPHEVQVTGEAEAKYPAKQVSAVVAVQVATPVVQATHDPLVGPEYREEQVVATVAELQVRAPVPQARQVVPEVKYPFEEQAVAQTAVVLKQAWQALLVNWNPVAHRVGIGMLQVAVLA
jgi:hypothetical protein